MRSRISSRRLRAVELNALCGAFALSALVPLCTACSSSPDDGATAAHGVHVAPDGKPWDTLAEWGVFDDAPAQEPAAGVVPFDVISVLFADNAQKNRWLYLPQGAKIGWQDTERWDVPVGSVAIKTFWFPNDARDESKGRRLIETRLLVHESSGYTAHTYVWNAGQTEAKREVAGSTLDLSWIDETGATQQQQYNIPNVFDCQSCHGQAPDTHLLGPRTRQLDREHDYGSGAENQLDHLAALGWFDVTPPATRVHLTDPYGTGPVVERARSYVDANCAHCHSDGGKAGSTNFWLGYESTDPATGDPNHWGVCKFPTSAGPASGGFKYDVVPGDPDHSIIVHRLSSTDSAVKMPPLLTRLTDPRGITVIHDWIAAMTPAGCPTQ